MQTDAKLPGDGGKTRPIPRRRNYSGTAILSYGFLPAVITGFLLTAIPNWTGRLPLQGIGLAALAALWGAGRLAVFFSTDIDPIAAGTIDVSFLLLVATAAAREVIAGRNWR